MDIHYCFCDDYPRCIIRYALNPVRLNMEVLSNSTGWIFIPDLPSHRAAWFLNSELKEHAIMRLGAPRKQSWDLTVFRRVLLSWQFWLLPFIFMCKYLRWSLDIQR